METFSEFLNEVFEFKRDSMDLDPDTHLIHQYRGEEYSTIDGVQKSIPYREMVLHTKLQGMPKLKQNLWVHVIHYPAGYGDVKGAHLQVHFDVSHVTDHDYLDSMRKLETDFKDKRSDIKPDPANTYSHAFARPDRTGLNPDDFYAGNAYAGLNRMRDTGLSLLFKKIAPHIVKSAWHVSKYFYPKLPVAFSSGSDVPGHAERKFMLYNKIANSLEKANLIEPSEKYVHNKYNFPGQYSWFRVIKPIHKQG